MKPTPGQVANMPLGEFEASSLIITVRSPHGVCLFVGSWADPERVERSAAALAPEGSPAPIFRVPELRKIVEAGGDGLAEIFVLKSVFHAAETEKIEPLPGA